MIGDATTHLSWSWIAFMLAVPLPAGLLVAWPIWRLRQPILGNLTGAAVIFTTAIALIGREHAELQRATEACLDAGTTCWPDPSAFARFAIYAGIGLLQVFAVFLASISYENRLRRRSYAPEWRR